MQKQEKQDWSGKNLSFSTKKVILFCNLMNQDLPKLIDKYLNGDASETEKELVDNWYLTFESKPGLTEQLSPEETGKAMAASFASIAGKLNFGNKGLDS